MISQDEAIRLISNTCKYAHALIVFAIMGELARKFGEDEQE